MDGLGLPNMDVDGIAQGGFGRRLVRAGVGTVNNCNQIFMFF